MESSTLEALIAAGGVIYASSVGIAYAYYKSSHKEKLTAIAEVNAEAQRMVRAAQVEAERLKFIADVTHPLVSLVLWTPAAASVRNLVETTNADRVMLLTAVNGEAKPTHTSAIWQYRAVTNSFVAYNNQPIDDHYISLLNQSKVARYVRVITKDLPKNTMIRMFYEQEGVIDSIWVMLGIKRCFLTGQVAYKYISVATHREEGFTDEDIRQALNCSQELRETIYASGFVPA